MIVVATRGDELELLVEDGKDLKDPRTLGTIRNKDTGEISAPLLLQQALKWGYWEPTKEYKLGK